MLLEKIRMMPFDADILMKERSSRRRSIGSVLMLSLVVLCILLSDITYALTAEGSTYSIGEFSTTPASSGGNGTEYSGDSSSVLSPVTNDAQGLESGAVVGVTGNAILTQNKTPMINSYSITPDQVNQSSWARLFISAVYTNSISVNITRPDDVIDTINMGYQSVYYYPYTNLVGRYDVVFVAEGNSVVTVDDYFDVVEVAEPYVPPEEDDEDDEPRRSGGGSSVATSSHNALYISLLHMCNGTPKIILEVTDDTGIVSGALVNVKSSITGDVDMDFTAGSDGRVEFEIPVGDYIITASAANHSRYRRDYELHCESRNLTAPEENQSGLDAISGQAVSDGIDSGIGQQDLQSGPATAELENASRILERQSRLFTTSFMVYLVFASMTFIFALILLLKLYRKDVDVDRDSIRYKPEPRVIILENKTLLDKKLMPIEKEIIKIEEEIEGLSRKNARSGPTTGPLLSGLKGTITVVDVPEIRPTPLLPIISSKEIQQTLDEDYKGILGLPYKKPADAAKSPDILGVPESVPKKSVDSKRASKTNPYLLSVPEEHAFVVCDGNKIYNLKQLLRQLKSMSEDTFRYHVTEYKNDFATWIYSTIGYKELSEVIGPIKSKGKMVEIIGAKINSLTSTKD